MNTINKTPEYWGNIYNQSYNLYENYTLKLSSLLYELIKSKNIDISLIEQRTKTVESFIDKIKRKTNKYKVHISVTSGH